MTETCSKKIKQKIAYRMVFVNGLNVRRPRTDLGHPLPFGNKNRSMSEDLYEIRSYLKRSLSNPDMSYFSITNKIMQTNSFINPETSMTSSHYENQELFLPYELVKPEKITSQPSVQKLIESFSCENRILTANEAKDESPINESFYINKEASKVEIANSNLSRVKKFNKRPVPTPRPNTNNTANVFKCLEANTLPESKQDNNLFKLKFEPKKNHLKKSKSVFEKINFRNEEIFANQNPIQHMIHNECEKNSNDHSKESFEDCVTISPYKVVALPTLKFRNFTQDEGSTLEQQFPDTSRCDSDIYLQPVDNVSARMIYSNSQQKSIKLQTDKFFYKLSKTVFHSKMFSFKRTQSLPNILSTESNNYETTDTIDIYKMSEEDSSLDEDEGWNSDEFESSIEDEKFNEQPVNPHTFDTINRKIYNIVSEILSTERAYVKRLYLLDKLFQDQLLKESRENNVIPEKALCDIFSNLPSIYKFHSEILLPELEKRLQKWQITPKIGDVFKTLGHCLVLYTDFVKNFDNSMSTLNHWIKKSPRFAAAVEQIQKQPQCENLTLQHHMLEPIQRVPRYKLLLQDYLKKLPTDSPDYNEAQESLVVISKVAENANSSLKDNDKFKILLNIQERIVDGLRGESLVTASRVFLKEGELTKLAARSSNKNIRTILLFSDLLLCCSATTIGKLRVRQIMDLIGLQIVQDDSLPKHSFRIQSRQRILDLTASTLEEKEEWVLAIKGAVEDVNNRRGTLICKVLEEDEVDNNDSVGQKAPLWVKDEDVTMCMLCTLKFGLIYRKHHCRGCGRVTCDKCSNYRAPLAYAGYQIQRLCYSCFKKLHPDIGLEKLTEDKEPCRNTILTRGSSALSEISGFLYWKAPGKSWSKEWIVLSEYVLYIQKKKQDIKARFTLPVPGFQVEPPSSAEEIDAAHPYCIKLHKEHKKELTYYLSSENKQDINKWEDHLRFAVLLEKLPNESEGDAC